MSRGMSRSRASAQDISFMDTEPMDLEEDQNDQDSDSVQGREEPSGSGSEAGGVLTSDGEEDSEYEGSQCGSYCPPPPIDITMADPQEVKRVYSELIESCRGALNNGTGSFDLDTTDDNFEKILKDNIEQGKQLFPQLQSNFTQSFYDTANDGPSAGLGASAVELHYAVKHNRVCVDMLSKCLSSSRVAVGFKAENFIEGLRSRSVDRDGGYSSLAAIRNLVCTLGSISYSIAPFRSLTGCVDMSSIAKQQAKKEKVSELILKVVKKKDVTKAGDMTRSEVLNDSSSKIDELKNKSDPVDALASGLKKTVKQIFRDEQRPPNVLEVSQADNVPDILTRLFGVAFMARDGHVALEVEGGESGSDPSAVCNLVLRPEKPPEKVKKSHETKAAGNTDRHQYVASFPIKLLREVAKQRQNGGQ